MESSCVKKVALHVDVTGLIAVGKKQFTS